MAGGVSNGTIFRVPRRDNYTIMSNVHLRDPNLTWKARGLMSTILSFPPDWDYTLAGLATCAKDNIASTRSGVIELENNGYLHRLQHRNSDGTWAKMEFQVYEDPAQNPYLKNQTSNESEPESRLKDKTNIKLKQKSSKNHADTLSHPVCDFPISDKPMSEKPMSEKPISENRTQLNTQEINNSKNQKLNQSITPEQEDGLMDSTTELPNSFLDTLNAIGYRFTCLQ